jgi:hypothetical protein
MLNIECDLERLLGGMDGERGKTQATNVMYWANRTVQDYPHCNVIVVAHGYINADGSFCDGNVSGTLVYNHIVRNNPNVLMVLCGHAGNPGKSWPEQGYTECDITQSNVVGGVVYASMQNYSVCYTGGGGVCFPNGSANGGDGWLRLFEFCPALNRITAFTYSPEYPDSGYATCLTQTTVMPLGSSAAPSTYGQPVSFAAAVFPFGSPQGMPPIGVPTGTVQFKIDGKPFGGPVSLSAMITISGATTNLSVGTHTVTADYSGANYQFAANTVTIPQTVDRAQTMTRLFSLAHPPVHRLPVKFTANVTVKAPGAGKPSGTVQFGVDGSSFGSPVNLSADGLATTPVISGLFPGSHRITAAYSGDANFDRSSTVSVQAFQ